MDCGFENENENENGCFRYRGRAIIIEDECVLFAKNEVDSYYYSVGGGVHLGEKAEDAVKLLNLNNDVEHIITCEY